MRKDEDDQNFRGSQRTKEWSNHTKRKDETNHVCGEVGEGAWLEPK